MNMVEMNFKFFYQGGFCIKSVKRRIFTSNGKNSKGTWYAWIEMVENVPIET